MKRCIELALRGSGHVAPNPLVGSVLVYGDQIIGEGYHQRYGGAHAEVNCINSVSDQDRLLIPEATLYVSLEPCSHFGKTPPCTNLILDKQIRHVVIGCTDPFPEVNGRGVSLLQNAGVDITLDVLKEECLRVNRRFIHSITHKRPYIILKWAQSGNGKMAGDPGSRLLISNDITNRLVHRWRSEESAILVGTNTALLDDPSLTNRLWSGPSPIRLVIDRSGRLPASLRVFDGSEQTFVLTDATPADGQRVKFINPGEGADWLTAMLHRLWELKIQSVLVEGGAETLSSFIDRRLWDEARVISNPDLIVDGGLEAPALSAAALVKEDRIANDIIHYYTPLKP